MREIEQWGADELLRWQAYARLEPFGEERMDLRFATLEAIILNKLNWSPVLPGDLMPDFAGDRKQESEPEELTPEEIRERALELCRTLQGEDQGGEE